MEQSGDPLTRSADLLKNPDFLNTSDPLVDLANEHWSAGHVTTLSEQVDGEVWVNCYDCNLTARRLHP